MKDQYHPFLRPLWRRMALVVFCAVWAAIEFYAGEPFWGTLAGGMAAYAIWMFIITYRPDEQAPGKE